MPAPPETTVATPVALLLHEPPTVASFRVMSEPTQTLPGPVMGELALTAMVFVVMQLPIAYVIVALPAVTPLIIPVEEPMEAKDGALLVHIPPLTASVNVVVAPLQTLDTPLMADGDGLTVMILEVLQPEVST